ncbi:hypothetical protein CALCODRAFT_513131 [Calocera cornea HHB12733]|uniref:Uncharacterized protein n=1 Tax=Calocera cornea HHB12733 TaxID=1353952 RepID=A0A165CG32_9BASI|nr:hypothetical protein CALCODRAFT_513131 [Calocera cornea HHB12733]
MASHMLQKFGTGRVASPSLLRPSLPIADTASSTMENDIMPTEEDTGQEGLIITRDWPGSLDGSTPSSTRTSNEGIMAGLDRDYSGLVNRLHLKRRFTTLQLEELKEFAADRDARSRAIKEYGNTIQIRDALDVIARNINQKWVIPINTQTEIAKEIYAYLLSHKCPAYVQSATQIMTRCSVRMHLDASVFKSTPQLRELQQWIVKRMGERRSWILKKIHVLTPHHHNPTTSPVDDNNTSNWKLRSTLDGTLAQLQKELTIPSYGYEFEIAHWIRYAFMRETLRVHLANAGTEVRNDDGTSEMVPKDFWGYLDDCLKAAKIRHGGDQGEWTNVGSLTPGLVNEPILVRSEAQIETERVE